MEFSDLIGKTIISSKQKKSSSTDDEGYAELGFSDGTSVVIVSYYGEWTGKSEDEYPTRIYVTDDCEALLTDCIEE